MNDKQYILFIDSGIGGLSILDTFLAKKNRANIIYYADVRNFPYGIKTEQEVGEILCNIYKDITKDYNIGMIVLACNTASVSALDLLRTKVTDIPIVGTVPAIKTAAAHTKNGKIGIVATETTLRLGYVEHLIEQFASDKKVFTKPSRRLVEAAENFLPSNEVANVVKDELGIFKQNGIDCIVLGCTHYSFLAKDIAAFFEGKVEVIDSREGVTNRIISFLPEDYGVDNPKHLLVLSKNDEQIIAKYKRFNDLLALFNEIAVRETAK